MEKRIDVTNNTAMPLYVGSNIVPPGETRDFPESQVPMHLRTAEESPPEAEAPKDAVLELLDSSIPEIVAALADLSDEDLARLKAAEEAGKTRKGLMAALAEEELKRANERQSGDPEMDKFVESLKAMGEEELFGQFDLVKENPAAIAAIEAEFIRRQGT